MSNTCDKIQDWVQQVQEHRTAGWDLLPEIYLYMDQVINYMERQLHLFGQDDEGVLLTPSMINDYMKDRVLSRPGKKKYNRERLAMLTVVCLLKQVLSTRDISPVLSYDSGGDYQKEVYESFRTTQERELAGVCEWVGQAAGQGKEELRILAYTLAIEASARQIAAERILNELSRSKEETEERPFWNS